MDSSRKQRWTQLQSLFEPGFRRMLLLSFLLHLLLPALYHTSWFPKKEPLKPPVYRVNLVNKIVKNPQAGRPEAVVSEKKPEPQVIPKPPAPKPLPPKPEAKPAAVVKPVAKPLPPKPEPEPVKPKPLPPKPEPEPKPEPVVAPPPAPPVPKPEERPVVSTAQETALQQRLAQLRAAQEQKQAEAERKARLDALRAAATAESQRVKSPVLDAPVGMLDGKGDEAGIAARAAVQEFIQQQWSLSKYQVIGNPEAEALLLYSAEGSLLHYRFIKKSGNNIFDESLVKAINKAKMLPQELPEKMEFHIVFNLKEMLDRQ